MKCREIREHLSAYLDDELDPELTSLVGEHLESCPECRRELDELRELTGLLGGLPRRRAPAAVRREVGEYIKRDLMAKELPEVPSHHSMFRKMVVAVGPLAAAVLIAVGVYHYGGPPQDDSADTDEQKVAQVTSPPKPTGTPSDSRPSGRLGDKDGRNAYGMKSEVADTSEGGFKRDMSLYAKGIGKDEAEKRLSGKGGGKLAQNGRLMVTPEAISEQAVKLWSRDPVPSGPEVHTIEFVVSDVARASHMIQLAAAEFNAPVSSSAFGHGQARGDSLSTRSRRMKAKSSAALDKEANGLARARGIPEDKAKLREVAKTKPAPVVPARPGIGEGRIVEISVSEDKFPQLLARLSRMDLSGDAVYYDASRGGVRAGAGGTGRRNIAPAPEVAKTDNLEREHAADDHAIRKKLKRDTSVGKSRGLTDRRAPSPADDAPVDKDEDPQLAEARKKSEGTAAAKAAKELEQEKKSLEKSTRVKPSTDLSSAPGRRAEEPQKTKAAVRPGIAPGEKEEKMPSRIIRLRIRLTRRATLKSPKTTTEAKQ